ncbi:MAG: carbohydrate ABC transporter permease, partial [Oscillospiraceae bacterium]|nr:carbohydrate ABC transporter permease [Oscillospiraceae bacterium]
MKNSFKKERLAKTLTTVFFTLLSIAYVFPVAMVLINSFKVNTFVKTDTFSIPSGESFAGFDNFITGMTFGGYPFWKSVVYSIVITLLGTFLILL